MISRRIQRRLILVFTVCLCPTKRTLGFNGLSLFIHPRGQATQILIFKGFPCISNVLLTRLKIKAHVPNQSANCWFVNCDLPLRYLSLASLAPSIACKADRLAKSVSPFSRACLPLSNSFVKLSVSEASS